MVCRFQECLFGVECFIVSDPHNILTKLIILHPNSNALRMPFHLPFVSEWIELRHIGDGMKVRKGDGTSASTRFSRWSKVFTFCFAGKGQHKRQGITVAVTTCLLDDWARCGAFCGGGWGTGNVKSLRSLPSAQRSAQRWRRICRPHKPTLCRCPPGRAVPPARSGG